MAWCLCSSHQIWSHGLGAQRVRWTLPMCIDCVSSLSYLAHVPIKYMECMATHNWHIVLRVTTYTNLGMAWLFYSFHQICSHSLCVICGLRWTSPLCIDCVSGLLCLAHAFAIYMECLTIHPWPVVYHVTTYTNLGMAWCFCSSHQIWSHRLFTLRLG